jgi:hypothetical protein
MRGYIKHCISLKLIKVDPLAGIELVKMKTKGHHPWESNECAQYEEHYPFGTRARLAYELLLQASQSRCDVVRMGRRHIRQGMMSMRRQKTDVPFNVNAAASGGDRRDAGERSPDLPCDGAGQAIHGCGLSELVSGRVSCGQVTGTLHVSRPPQGCRGVSRRAGRDRSPAVGVVRLVVDLAGAGLHEGGER